MIKFYGQIKDGVLQQICGVDSDETLAAMKLANQGVEFVPTPYFGGASEFYYDGAAVTPKPEKPEPHYYWETLVSYGLTQEPQLKLPSKNGAQFASNAVRYFHCQTGLKSQTSQ